ncbi:Pyridine nucleotide-disulphide oxidoreductase [Neorhodopirellula lusitana]|uniref:Pyridine nucleotide-disulphide oxidoreductase n=1 Tax=Neorhodopirellula lusitana TaxID=445327 RepID=A0ABY1QNC5_9BACT|nr:FAD-dependent oxidoreductase [Neorhodopirellula lusitana]SMP75926.1 Pyridine nucleotide-disulphide oxidoreductase [Neorhodopirellula lusitana]
MRTACDVQSTAYQPKADQSLPVAIIGAGPIGLAAAANLAERGTNFVVMEAGSRVAASMWEWRHVRLFTPWSLLIDPASKRLLQAAGTWREPNQDEVPYAHELIEQFLDPLAALEQIAPHIQFEHKVISISRDGHDRMRDGTRDEAPFLIVTETPAGPRRTLARAVIDASGTWTTPNPMGAGGVPADGELQNQSHIRYGMPDVLGRERNRYAGKRTLVVGSGHSATGSVLNLIELAKDSAQTSVTWGVRRCDPTQLWGSGCADEIAERGALGTRIKEAVDGGKATLLTGLSIAVVQDHADGMQVVDVQGTPRVIVDEIIVATGSRPNLNMVRELRLEFDIPTEASKSLGPLIDPNHHSCGSVPRHGAQELRQPENGFYLAGMKSYGRAPTFLMATGFEQVRSIVAELTDKNVSRDLPTVV